MNHFEKNLFHTAIATAPRHHRDKLADDPQQGWRSMGAAGAFAPVNFQKRVQCTRPDKELSYKWPFFSPKKSFFNLKRTFLMQKMWFIFKFVGCGINPIHLKSLMHPSCQVLGATPAMNVKPFLIEIVVFTPEMLVKR